MIRRPPRSTLFPYPPLFRSLSQLRRDRITFATMIVIPLVQLMLFGYAINTNPKRLPTAVLVQDDSAFARSFLAAMRATDYFDLRYLARSEADLDELLLSGAAQFRSEEHTSELQSRQYIV